MKKTININKPSSVDEYITSYPKEIREILEKFRATIRKAAPDAEEMLSYSMPAYKFNGMLVYFAANKNHTGFYPTPSAIEAFKKELSAYGGAKGSVQFPYEKPVPWGLITKIVKFRVLENLEKIKSKEKRK